MRFIFYNEIILKMLELLSTIGEPDSKILARCVEYRKQFAAELKYLLWISLMLKYV